MREVKENKGKYELRIIIKTQKINNLYHIKFH
jgi:hypothetical protein